MKKLMVPAVLILLCSLTLVFAAYAVCPDGNCDVGYLTDKSADGTIFRGYAKKTKHGQGAMTWPNGDAYAGDWRDDNMEGYGTMTWGNGDVYEGEWKDNLMHGHGTYIWANGDEYIGSWTNGVQDGHGIFIFADGVVISGAFIDGRMPR